MRSNRIGMLILIAALAAGCSVGGSGGGSSTPPVISTVSSTQLVAITVTPAATSVPTGTTKQYTATGEFGDGSMKVITAAVTWHSSSPDIATIDTSGLADAISSATTDTTMIVATSGNVSGSAILAVTGGNASPADNVLPITVNGSLCSAGSYLNKPCVTITVCTPGTATCQPLNDVILDTGSFGLRIFNQVLGPVTPSPIASGSGVLAECVLFGDGTSLWGQVKTVDVILGNERAAGVPIQVIDSTFPGIPAVCTNAEQNPATAGFNGILGLGVLNHDCGSKCAPVTGSAGNGMYYSCTGTASTCSGATAPLVDQVQNPVASLPTDSNGIIVELQSVPLNGLPSANGILVLGIGTRPNNTPPAGVMTYNTDVSGEIRTIFNGVLYASIIDSGSNGLFFPPPSGGILPNCPSPNTVWFCPAASTVILSATNEGASGLQSNAVFFQIGNLNNLTSSPNRVFSNIGGSLPNLFDWGLPAYLGRNIFVGISEKASSLGTGPYFAY